MSLFPRQDSRSARAASWNVRLGSGEITEAERAEMLEWMLEPGNAREYEAHRQLLDWTHDLGPAQKAELGRTLRSHPGPHRTPAPGRRLSWAAAACAAVLLAVLGQQLWTSGRVPRSYASGVGETRSVSLPDGSTTALNTATHLSWMGGTERRVRLSGEALFAVRPDHRRPFQIELKGSRITVLGTRFNVYEKANEDVVVTVLEGRVVVQGQAPGGPWREELTAAQELEYAPSGRRVVRVVDPTDATQWQEGKFRSPAASLDRVVSELRRYTRSQIIIADPSLNALNVGGVFDLHDVPLALKRVVESADVPIILTRSGDQFVLSRGAAGAGASEPAASAPHGPRRSGS